MKGDKLASLLPPGWSTPLPFLLWVLLETGCIRGYCHWGCPLKWLCIHDRVADGPHLLCVCMCVCVRACVCMRTPVAVHEIIRGSMSPLLFLMLMCFPPWQLTTLHWLGMFYYFCQSWSCACDIQNRTAKWESCLASVAKSVERLYWRTLTYRTAKWKSYLASVA